MCRPALMSILSILVWPTLGSSSAGAQTLGTVDLTSERASLISILSDPTSYQEKQIRTIGVLWVEQESDVATPALALFFSREQMDNFVTLNALTLNISLPESYERLGRMHGKYVFVEGRVDARETGHMSVFAAGLIDVNRIQLIGNDE